MPRVPEPNIYANCRASETLARTCKPFTVSVLPLHEFRYAWTYDGAQIVAYRRAGDPCRPWRKLADTEMLHMVVQALYYMSYSYIHVPKNETLPIVLGAPDHEKL